MLVQYAVENYKSIKDEIVINFGVNKRFQNSPEIITGSDAPVPLYRCIGLIGPNASGKSNIIDSLFFAFTFILNTIKRNEASKINIEPFAFTDEKGPTSFEFIFYQKAVKYVYGFSINEDEVIDEYLMGYFTSKPKTLFNRTAGQKYEFKGNDVKIQEEISKKTNPNRLYMPVAAEWGYAPLKEVYDWFVFQSRQDVSYNINEIISVIIEDPERKKVFVDQLQKADFNIKDIYVVNQKIDQRSYDFMEKFIKDFLGENTEAEVPKTHSVVHVIHENQQGESFDIRLDEDSTGTEDYVKDLAELFYISKDGGLILEDELGKTFHTKLTEHYLNIVQSPFYNSGNAQMIFSSYNTKILNILNPDQIYLVDKDELTGATVVKLLDDYVIREKDNIELGYLKGRYGSLPFIRS